MKRIIFTVLCLGLLIPGTASAEDLPELDTSHYFVQDHAGILDDETINELNEMGTHLEEGTGAEMLLMTMQTVGQTHRQDYALEALRGYGVGKENDDNGIVIFLNLDNGNEFNNRGIEVQVGYGVEGYLNDAKIGRIIDNEAMSHFEDAAGYTDQGDETQANASYQEGLRNIYTAIYNESLEAYGYEDGEFTRDEPADDTGSEGSLIGTIFRVIFTLAVLFILFKIITGSGGGPRGPGGRGRRRGPVVFFPSSGSGGSGFGGGSSGGFGGFGGGSGGGGGAGRGF